MKCEVGMRNSQYSFETRKRSFISAFSICMTVLLKVNSRSEIWRRSPIKCKKHIQDTSKFPYTDQYFSG